ncbi:MAG TPA: hypothetical protein P5052_01750 [Candidatus Paceibacterota bacterium]|nr:hypothetical protein [Candidatus Paceibacterota bacterium]
MKKKIDKIPILLGLYAICFCISIFLYLGSMMWWSQQHLIIYKIIPVALPILLWLAITKLLAMQRKANENSNCYEGALALIEAPFFAVQFLCFVGFIFSLLILCAE